MNTEPPVHQISPSLPHKTLISSRVNTKTHFQTIALFAHVRIQCPHLHLKFHNWRVGAFSNPTFSSTIAQGLLWTTLGPPLHHVHCRQGICSLCGFKSSRFRHNSLHSMKLYTILFAFSKAENLHYFF